MIHSPATVMRGLLIDSGEGTMPSSKGDWPVWAGNIPPNPDDAAVVYDTGSPKVKYMAGTLEGGHGIQVYIRAVDYDSGWYKANRILAALVAAYRETVAVAEPTEAGTGTSHYLVQCVSNVGPILSLGKETPTSKRNVFTINMTATIHQCPNGV